MTSSSEGSVHAQHPDTQALRVVVQPNAAAVGVRASEESVSSVCMEEDSPTTDAMMHTVYEDECAVPEHTYDPLRTSQALGLTGPVTLERLQDAVASSPKAAMVVPSGEDEDMWEDARSVATLRSCGSLNSMRSGL